MPQQSLRFLFLGALATGSILGSFVISSSLAKAQIVPDATLGRERSILRTNIPGVQGLIDRIDGGAQRGGNLFHSFSDFNVSRGQQVYFANPISINNIISRVTGRNFSSIDGTLGVLGGGNLFLINPNGIIFGSNARLDIRGSFVASTADKIPFADGYVFSATAPESEPLLTVNAPLGLASWQTNSGTITTQADLSTGKDLSLVANNLDLQGQLKAGGDLNLIATDRLKARDSSTSPFIASAGNQLLVQGNQSVDIAALNHPDSSLSSSGDMLLRSANTVGGDAHFTTGGNFRIEQLDGQPGSLYSPNDPVVQASGDVSFDSYTGASLHILAGGSVTIPGTITITGPEVTGFLSETVTLSNGSSLAIDGSTQPTVDIRAGTTAFGTTGITGSTTGFTPVPGTSGTGTNANITIGSIINQSGLVYLSNQYQPNLSLSGDISVGSINTTADPASGLSGGSVVIDSRGQLTFSSINASGGTFDLVPGLSLPDFSTLNIGGNGGDVTLLASGQIFMPFPSTLFTYGLTGGAITINSSTAIVQENAPRGTDPFALSWIESDSELSGPGGNVNLSAPSISIGGNIFTTMVGEGRGGNLNISAGSLVTDQATIASQTLVGQGRAGDVTVNASDSITVGTFTTLGSVNSSSGGRAGDVTVQTRQLSITDGGQISSSTFGVGDGGNISVIAEDIALSGFLPGDLATTFVGGGFVPSAIITNSLPGAEGNSGSISITTGTLTLANAAAVSTTAQGIGEAGDITINSSKSVRVSGTAFTDFTTPQDLQASAISSELFTGATGRGGNIAITTPILAVTNGGAITASTGGDGDAGSIILTATQSALFDGVATFGDTNAFDRISRAQVFAGQDATGNGGSLTITTPSLTLSNGGQLTAQTNGVGNAGDLNVDVSNSLNLDGVGSGILASATLGSTGQGGSIFIANPKTVDIQNRAQITAQTEGTGKGGNLQIQANSLSLGNGGQVTVETTGSGDAGIVNLQINKLLSLDGSGTGIIARTGPTSSGQGGDIVISNPKTVQVLNGAQITAATQGTGKGGNVQVQANSLSLGNGGQVTVETQGSGSAGTINLQLPQALTLDGPNTGLIARTAPGSSGAGGSILINSPEVVQILNGAQITAETQGSGPSGSIQLRANSLAAANGGRLTVETQGPGNAGSINLQVQQSFSLDGSGTGIIARTGPTSSGQGGDIVIGNPETLQVLNGAQITAATQGSGKGGNVQVQANSLSLGNGGQVTVETQGLGSAGTINLQLPQALTLDGPNAGLIARTAPGSTGAGGSILINSPASVQVLNGAQITAETQGSGQGGSIQLRANSLAAANGGRLTVETQGPGNAGSINLQLNKSLSLDGSGTGIIARTGPTSSGQGGDIVIGNPETLQVLNGAQITAATQGSGKGGNVQVQANSLSLGNGGQVTVETQGSGSAGTINLQLPKALTLDGPNAALIARTAPNSSGAGGSILINNPEVVQILNGAQITAETQGSGPGGSIQLRGGSLSQINGGKLTVATQGAGNAGSIDLRLGGPLLLNGFNSGLLALTSPASSGSGGKINIQTLGTVNILNSAQIAANTEGAGPGGNIDINARAINLDTNGQITAGTKGQGVGGNITLKANRIDVANGAQVTGQTQGSGNAGNIRLTVDEALNLQGFSSGIAANTGPDSTGNGGNISVFSLKDINIQNGARIAVDSQGQGAGGDIRIQTRSINLNNFGVITAETASTKGGNISILSSDPLYMTNNSRISTTAGTAKAGGDGGNIVIRAPFLTSGATDNSDITANAYSGRGGRVEITTNGILGMIVRSRSDLETALGTSDPNRLDPALLPTSDITAISQTNPNLNGVVDIRSLDSDPFQNVYVLPSTTVDASKLVAKGCSTGPTVAKSPGTLVVTGRGGLPPSPTDQLNASGLLLGWENTGEAGPTSQNSRAFPEVKAQSAPQMIVEAGAIALGQDGQVTLVAKATEGVQGTFANQGQVCSVKADPTGASQVNP